MLRLCIRRKRANQKLSHEVRKRKVRDLPCIEGRTTAVIELYKFRWQDCGINHIAEMSSNIEAMRRPGQS